MQAFHATKFLFSGKPDDQMTRQPDNTKIFMMIVSNQSNDRCDESDYRRGNSITLLQQVLNSENAIGWPPTIQRLTELTQKRMPVMRKVKVMHELKEFQPYLKS